MYGFSLAFPGTYDQAIEAAITARDAA